MSRDHRKPSRYNQQFFRDWGGAGPLTVGLMAILLVAVGFYFAFAKSIPFTSPGYQVKATFTNAVNIAINSPIRIAGINVGKVTDVEPTGDNTTVTFTVDENGRPVREDASAQIRPRLFLEGNWFVDLDPGTPEEPRDARRRHDPGEPDRDERPGRRHAPEHPPAAPAGQPPEAVRRPRHRTERDADRERGPDLRAVGQGTERRRGPEPALPQGRDRGPWHGDRQRGLPRREPERARAACSAVSVASPARSTSAPTTSRDSSRNFATFTGALAAESENLSETIRELPPTLTIARTSLFNLNRSLPALRGFAIAITPGVNEVPRTIRLVRPLTDQLKPLLTESELLGLTQIIKRNTPASTTSDQQTLKLLPQLPVLRPLRGRQRRADR